MSTIERELKLVPEDAALLDLLAAQTRFGELSVVGRRHEVQRNSFFDTASKTLSAAHVGFRRRTVEGESLATLVAEVKRRGLTRGDHARNEIEVQLDAETPPAGWHLAHCATRLTSGARTALAEEVAAARVSPTELPLRTPFLEMQTERTILDLDATTQGWSVELALDRVQLVGHDYAEVEIEAELKRGDEAALEAARHAIEALGAVHEAQTSTAI